MSISACPNPGHNPDWMTDDTCVDCDRQLINRCKPGYLARLSHLASTDTDAAAAYDRTVAAVEAHAMRIRDDFRTYPLPTGTHRASLIAQAVNLVRITDEHEFDGGIMWTVHEMTTELFAAAADAGIDTSTLLPA